MKRKRLYIALSVIILLLLAGLVGWAIFVGRQQQELQQGTTDLGVLGSGGSSGGSSSGGGLFGGVFGNDTGSSNSSEDIPQPVLRQLYNLPTAGYAKLRTDAIRFVDRATGHVFEKKLPDGSVSRVDQTTVPQVYEAVLLRDGRAVIRQYIDEQRRLVSVLSEVESEDLPTLPANELVDIASSPTDDQIVFIAKTASGSDLQTFNIASGTIKTIMNSPLQGWLVQESVKGIILTQKASGGVPVSALLISEDGTVSPILSQELGLVTNVSPDGSKIIYSTTNEEGNPLLFLLNMETKAQTPLNIVGIANKCVWLPNSTQVYCALPTELPDGTYPDDWYKGSVHFSDAFWKIDTALNSTEFILSPQSTSGISIDAVKLTTDSSGKVIFFINKTDQTLWSLTLPEKTKQESQ